MPQANLNSIARQRTHPLARMLPLFKYQRQAYPLAEIPPGLRGYQPRWEVVNAVLGTQQSILVKVDLMDDFHWLANLGSATANTVGGFRAQFYDLKKNIRMQDRGIQLPNLGGAAGGAAFLREPYRFDLPKSQLQILLQNMEPGANTVQLVIYGVCLPFSGGIR